MQDSYPLNNFGWHLTDTLSRVKIHVQQLSTHCFGYDCDAIEKKEDVVRVCEGPSSK